MGRATRYIRAMGAADVFPCSGPPCFLDDELFEFNDFYRDETNIFPDQAAFLDYLRGEGITTAHLSLPGTVATFGEGRCEVSHPWSDEEIASIFAEKRAYLEAYRQRQRPVIERVRNSWPVGEVDIVPALKQWWEPLIATADHTCAGINGRILLEVGDEAVVVDFLDRRVDTWRGEECRYRFRFERGPVESCIVRHLEDWVNELFLSCRFRAQRDGLYNEYVYSFFKSLSLERMQYVEGCYAERSPVGELAQCGDYLIQRRCPHLKADLTRFGNIEDGVLTCGLHGWQFELATGRCLTSDDRRLYTRPARSEYDGDGSGSPTPNGHAERPSPLAR